MDSLVNSLQTTLYKDVLAKPTTKAFWLFNRLKRMSFEEMIHRLYCSFIILMEKFGFFLASNKSSIDLYLLPKPWIINTPKALMVSPVSAADRLIDGKINLFALRPFSFNSTPSWNTDPKTKVLAPLLFGKTINYRDRNIVGDVKYLWELNRHLQFVTLSQAYAEDCNSTYLEELRIQITSWLDQCPYPLGINWTSSLEVAIRLINWSFVWQLLGGHRSPLFKNPEGKILRKRWLTSIYQHTHFIKGNYSRYSSANNHLIGEASGLFIACLTWPYWDEMKKWSLQAKTILENECIEQTYAEGVSREQSLSYQQFVLDFLIIAGTAGSANDVTFSKTYWNRIETMIECIAAFLDVNGNMPMIGDADDGFVVKLSHEEDFCPYRSLVATGALLFHRSDLAAKAKKIDDKTRWLFGEESDQHFETLLKKKSLPFFKNTFPEGGYYIFGKHFNTFNEIKGIIDCGPLGYLSIAAHGHADALGLTLSIAGLEFLIDPGTYAYHTHRKWRNYFKGTAAHNTARIDGENQSVIGGSFMWLKRAKSTCEKWESNASQDYFIGTHNGYMRLDDPVIHTRTILFLKSRNNIRVIDQFSCNGRHTIERFWHFHENCLLTYENQQLSAKRGAVSLTFQSNSAKQSDPKVYRGQSDPIRGWVSRRFDCKEPTTTVLCTDQIKGDTVLTTDFTIQIGY